MNTNLQKERSVDQSDQQPTTVTTAGSGAPVSHKKAWLIGGSVALVVILVGTGGAIWYFRASPRQANDPTAAILATSPTVKRQAATDYARLQKADAATMSQADKYDHYMSTANTLITLKKYDDALAQLDLAAKQGDAVTFMLPYDQGLAYEAKGDKSKAADYYNRAKNFLAAHPDHSTGDAGVDAQVQAAHEALVDAALERVR